MGSIQVLKRQAIVLVNQRADWLRARELVKDKGGLPSHVLHDDLLVRRWPTLSEPEREKFKAYYPAWARELLVYPPKGSQFKRGKDVVDCLRDNAGREWLFPASCIPKEAIGRVNVGLFVDPESIEVSDSRVVVLANPLAVVILNPFIQGRNQMGMVDRRTRLPVAVRAPHRLTLSKQRWLLRIDKFDSAAVRPLVRDFDDLNIMRYVICADIRHFAMLGVAYVGMEYTQSKVRVTREDDCRLIVEGTKEQLDAAVRLLV